MNEEKTEKIITESSASAKLKIEIPVVVENKQAERKQKNALNNEAQSMSADDAGKPKEINGPKGLEPTRYGDWEAKGRCYDF